jgi:hypothetical protein
VSKRTNIVALVPWKERELDDTVIVYTGSSEGGEDEEEKAGT